MRPGGAIRPGGLARRRGISFALDFAAPDALPWIAGNGTRGEVPGAYQNSAARGTSRHGWGMQGATGYWAATSGVTYSPSTTAGTLIVAAIAEAASSATPERMLFGNVNSFPTGPTIDLLKYSDGKCYFGWINGSDKRVQFSTSGLWEAGDTVVAGVTWGPQGQVAYVNGVARGSNSSTGYASLAGGPFYVGKIASGATWYWNDAGTGTVLYVLIFDQELTAAEMADAYADIWWWRGPVSERLWVPVRVAGFVPFIGISSATLGVVGDATGAVALDAAASASLGASGSASGASIIASASVGAFGVAGSVAGGIAASASTAGAAGVAGSAAGAVALSAATSVAFVVAGGIAGAISVDAVASATLGIAGVFTLLSGAEPAVWPDWVPPGRRVAIGADVRRVAIPADRRVVAIPSDRRAAPFSE